MCGRLRHVLELVRHVCLFEHLVELGLSHQACSVLAVETLTAWCYADEHFEELILFIRIRVVLCIQEIVKLTELLSKILQVNMHSIFLRP